MNGTWDTTILYSSFDDPQFDADMAALDENISAINAFAAELDALDDGSVIKTYLALREKQAYLSSKLFI